MKLNKHFSKLRNLKGLTLVEVVLAMALSSLLFVSLGVMFQQSIYIWNEANVHRELTQHGRTAMWRMTSELRYSGEIIALGTQSISGNSYDYIEFPTTVFVDDIETDTENIRYEVVKIGDSFVLRRTEAGTNEGILAGTTNADDINVDLFNIVGYKIDINGDLAVTTLPSAMDMIFIKLILKAKNNETFKINSLVSLRNKNIAP